MAKTALEMTPQEWQAYHPGTVSEERERQVGAATHQRWQQARRVARRASTLLRKRFGASRVVAFGSLTHRTWFTRWSDIDLAAWGIPPERFYSAVATVTGLSPAFKIDLVDPETCRPALLQAVEREGVEL